MLGRMGRDAGSLLGVEIASDSVRMLQLQRRRGRQKVVAWAMEPLPTQACLDWAGDVEPLLAALRQAHRRCGSRQRQVAVALSGAQVICKLCELPASVPEEEHEARLLEDARHLFPFPVNDLALDFQVQGPSSTHPDTLDVLVGAYRQSLLEPMLHRFDEAGLEVVAVEVDSLALRRAMPAGRSACALLQMEGNQLTLHGWSSQPMGWRRELRLENGRGRHGVLAAVDQLISADVRSLVGDELLITGSLADEALACELESRLGMACGELAPIVEFDLKGRPEALGCMALSLGLALGECR